MNEKQDRLKQLKFNAVTVLLSSGNEAIVYFTRRDLLDEEVAPLPTTWKLPAVQKLLKKQISDGSWPVTGKKKDVYPPYHYHLVETFRNFRILVERYRLNREHPAITAAAEFIFSCQSPEGDIRGMIGNQYATYYNGYFFRLLINAGYEDDPRVEKGMKWLLSMRQDDGGWTVPVLTGHFDSSTMNRLTSEYAEPFEPDRTQPFSHNWTNMVLQAFAAHSKYRYSEEAKAAAELLKSRFFQPDFYGSYRDPGYWVRFVHWWPNLLMALESLSLMDFSAADSDIAKALDWFIDNQKPDGLWDVSYKKGDRITDSAQNREERLWMTFSVCRVFKRFFS